MIELALGVGVIGFLMALVVIVLWRVKGEVIRVWAVNTVSYFPRMKTNRWMRVKIERGVLQTLNSDIVRLIDAALLELQDKEAKGTALEAKADVPKELGEKWLKLRGTPEELTIWTTFTKKRWRWHGEKGLWVYIYHLFSHDEMTLHFKRHRIWRVHLLPQPIGVYAPSKRDWVVRRLQEAKAKGKPLTNDLKKSFEREYTRQVKGQKWLLVMLHPTVTAMGEAQTVERVEGFQSFLPVIAHAMGTAGGKLAKYESAVQTAKGFMQTEKGYASMVHELSDEVGKKARLIHTQAYALKEKSIPTVYSPESSPMPFVQPSPPKQEPSGLRRTLAQELNWIYVVMFMGFAMTFFGVLQYATDPQNFGLLAFGTIIFLAGVFFWWRDKKTKTPILKEASESLREKAEELKESAQQEGP